MDVDIERAAHTLAETAGSPVRSGLPRAAGDPFDAPPFDRIKALETVVAVREWATEITGAEQAVEPDPDLTPDAETSTPGD